jgi:hypothetical protein
VIEFVGWALVGAGIAAVGVLVFAAVVEVFHR